MRLIVLALFMGTSQAIDNGLGLTPPRGWRSWNLFGPAINDTVMRSQMDAVLDTSRKVGGVPTTLASLGFDWISMDDGWQKCNCSTRGSVDPSLPTCPVCKTGGCSWHTSDAEGGKPIVDLHKFPDMKAMVSHGHSLGLKVGSYMNNCVCMEGGDPPMGNHCNGETHYEQDVDFLVENGFDVRSANMPNFPVWDPATKAKDAHCPMNLYRTGGDIGPDFASTIGEAYAVVQYSDRPDPLSHPGCWAYPDMSEIGLDMSNGETMDRIWTTITNKDALAINNAWVGHPGTLVKSYPATGDVSLTVDQAPCNGQPESLGWKLEGTMLVNRQAAAGEGVCLGTQSGPTGQTTQGESSCPPPTTQFGGSGCGSVFVDCNQQAKMGSWTHNATTGILMFQPSTLGGSGSTPAKPQCLRAQPPAPVGGFYGGPKAANTASGGCPNSKAAVANSTRFTFTDKGEIQVGTGVCLVARTLYGPQLWSKPLSNGMVAILVVNILDLPQSFTLPLGDVPTLECGSSCTVRDVWDQKYLGPVTTHLPIQLRSHESGFFIVGPAAVEPFTL
eukprot:gene2093-11945_t